MVVLSIVMLPTPWNSHDSKKRDHFNAALYLIFQLSDFQRIQGLYLRFVLTDLKNPWIFFFETKSLQKEMEGEKKWYYIITNCFGRYTFFDIMELYILYIPFCWKGITMSNLSKIIYN